MPAYQNLEHTADLKIRTIGKTKEEVFANMAKGMFANIYDQTSLLKDQPIEMELILKTNDIAELLVDFLNELIYLSDINDVIYNTFELVIFEKDRLWHLESVLKGFKVSGFKLEVKAATYNELKLEEDLDGNWLAEVVFDI